jgi:hypothetical protein
MPGVTAPSQAPEFTQHTISDPTDQDILENTKEFADSLVDSTFLEDRPENREKFLSQVWTYVIDTAKELKGE